MGLFQTTRWSLVLQTRDANARHALEELCRSYRAPVLAYIRRLTRSPADAEDLTQAFFERLLRQRAYAKADPVRGSFRAFLLTALRRFLINADAFRRAAKRGGLSGTVTLSDPDDAFELQALVAAETPEAAFDRDFALAVLRRAMAQLEAEAAAAGKADQYAALRDFLGNERGGADYEEVAQRMGMRSNTVAVYVHRLRRRLRTLIRKELDDIVDDSKSAEAEFTHLRLTLDRATRRK